MAKILVGRDKSKEVEVGNSLSSAKTVNTDVKEEKKEEELVEAPVEVGQVVVAEEGDDAPAETEVEAASKRRGKKRGKA